MTNLSWVGVAYISTTSDATLPLAISFVSSTAFSIAGKQFSASKECLNFVEESVYIPRAIDVLLTLFLSNIADSKIILFVSLSTEDSLPPTTPAIAIGCILSAITMTLSFNT